MYAAPIIFVVFVLGDVIVICRIPLGRFIQAVKEPWLIAFSTASSEAALPLPLENMEKFGVPKHIVSFVLPTGYPKNGSSSPSTAAGPHVYAAGAVLRNHALGEVRSSCAAR